MVSFSPPPPPLIRSLSDPPLHDAAADYAVVPSRNQRPLFLARTRSSPQDMYEERLRAQGLRVDPTWLQHWQQNNSVAEDCPCFLCTTRRAAEQEAAEASDWRDRIRRLDEWSDRDVGRR